MKQIGVRNPDVEVEVFETGVADPVAGVKTKPIGITNLVAGIKKNIDLHFTPDVEVKISDILCSDLDAVVKIVDNEEKMKTQELFLRAM